MGQVKAIAWAGAAAAAVLLAGQAEAQQADARIVVTATRQDLPLAKVPLAVTVIAGQDLQERGIAHPADLGSAVPGLSIDRVSGMQITIRGVSSTDGTEKGDPSAAFLVDGVYIARPQDVDVGLFDIDRIEILRGPQGTRFGRNTTAGLVNVISRAPQLGESGGGFSAVLGSLRTVDVQGHANFPLGDATALRVAASYAREDSVVRSRADDAYAADPFRRDLALRASLRHALGSRGEVLLRLDWAQRNGTRWANAPTSNFFRETPGHVPILDSGGNAIWSPVAGPVSRRLVRDLKSLPVPTGRFGFGAAGHEGPWIDNHQWGVHGQLRYPLGAATLEYTGAYRRSLAHENLQVDLYPYASGMPIPGLGAPNPGCPATDVCAFPAAHDRKHWQTSHELRVLAPLGNAIQLVAGANWFREESRTSTYIVGSPQFIIGFPNVLYGFPEHTIARSLAAFGEATWHLSPRVRVSAGLRHTRDSKFRTGHTVRLTALTDRLAIPFNAYANDARLTGRNLSWRLGLDADLGDGLAYASLATGYKQGGFGDGCMTGTTTRLTSQGERCNAGQGDPQAVFYRPEKITAWELGYRGRIAPWLSVDAAAYHYDYRDMQLTSVVIVNGAPSIATTNAARSRIDGLELGMQLRPAAHHRIDMGGALADARYRHFCPGGTVSGDPLAACLPGTLDFAGRRLDRAPVRTLHAGYSWTIPVGGDAELVAAVRTRYRSRAAITEYTIRPVQYFVPGHTTTDVTLTARLRALTLTAFARNLENFIELQNITSGSVTPGRPRTYGLQASVGF